MHVNDLTEENGKVNDEFELLRNLCFLFKKICFYHVCQMLKHHANFFFSLPLHVRSLILWLKIKVRDVVLSNAIL